MDHFLGSACPFCIPGQAIDDTALQTSCPFCDGLQALVLKSVYFTCIRQIVLVFLTLKRRLKPWQKAADNLSHRLSTIDTGAHIHGI